MCSETKNKMEVDHNLIFNCASVIATFVFLTATGVTVLRGLRLRWPVKVNCWFCNNDTTIYRSCMKWWKCPSCEQYNGFTKDGDYAYDIPEQSTQLPKIFAQLRPTHGKLNDRNSKKILCERCNQNEELKMFELGMFKPKGFFDKGVEHFKRQLEAKYPLCDNCKILVRNVLQEQSMWLTRYKMLFYKQKSVSAVINNAEKLDKMIRALLTLLTCGIMCQANYRFLPLVGACLQLSTFIVNPMHRGFDAILTFLWICIGFGGPSDEIQLYDLYAIYEWPSLENVTRHHFTTVLIIIIGLANVTARHRNPRHFKATFKKLESPNVNKGLFSMVDEGFSDEAFESRTFTNCQRTVTNDRENVVHKKSLYERNGEDEELISTRTSTGIGAKDYPETGSRHILKFDENSEQYSLNESLSTLRGLTLGERRAGRTSSMPSMFQMKVYGSTSPDLFRPASKSRRKFVLAPPKLKSFAQTSWVAGGYWQVDVDSPSLSRSSSQSSGFGSAGSNFGPSREPSVTKEIDNRSVVSDNAQFYYMPRPDSVNSVNSCCRHAGPIKFGKCESPLYNQPSNIMRNPTSLQSLPSDFSPVLSETKAFYERCSSLHNENTNATAKQQSQTLIKNRPTVWNSTVWLTILLGGSLVFNIAVFCTIILR